MRLGIGLDLRQQLEMRLTPHSRYIRAFSVETVEGLHSIVHSVTRPAGIRSRMRRINAAGNRLGVPPPKKIVVGASWGANRSSSSSSAST